MRENADAKGRRYLTEGRLVLEHVDGRMVRARCRGQGAVYTVTFDGEAWECSCPAPGRCAHLIAAWLVTAPGEAA
jgi:uncharacterized Zn finger protein